MKSKVVLIYLFSLVYIVISQSCTDTGCGPFPNMYKINGFEVRFQELIDTDDLSLGLHEITNNKVQYNRFAISFNAETENYNSNVYKLPSLGIIQSAYACSPVEPGTTETVTDIRVFCNQEITDSFPENTNINSLFDILYTEYHSDEVKRMPLLDFINQKPTTKTHFSLLLNRIPSEEKTYIFKIEYEQDGVDMDYFEHTTEAVTLTVD